MANVIGIMCRTYCGLDADKTAQVGLTGEHYFATDTGIVYKWDQTRWRGGYDFIPRPVAAEDFGLVSFTIDGTWKIDGLDLSGIVPVGAKAVQLTLYITDDAANSTFQIRQDATNVYNAIIGITQVANIPLQRTAIVGINADRLMDYQGTNVVFTTVSVSVLGWFI